MEQDFLAKIFGDEENTGVQTLSALLLVQDEQFELISEPFLLEFEKTLKRDVDCRNQLALALKNQLNLDVGNIEQTLDTTLEGIKKELSDELSPKKIDFLVRFVTLGLNAVREYLDDKNNIFIPLQKCHEDAKTPTYAHATDAGLDIYALEEITIAPGETKIIPTGLKVAIPIGYELQIRDKSGIASKTKLRVANAPATIDSEFRGEVGVIIENIEAPIQDIIYDFDYGAPVIKSILHGKSYTIEKGQKIAQFVLNAVPHATFFEVEDIQEIKGDRGGGYGSSGLF